MSEHVLVFPERAVAEQIADELRDEGFTEVRVFRAPLAGEDDPDADEWAVYVREANVADETGAVASGLHDRFVALTSEHDGWYDPDPEPRYPVPDIEAPVMLHMLRSLVPTSRRVITASWEYFREDAEQLRPPLAKGKYECTEGADVRARSVVVACGVEYRKLEVPVPGAVPRPARPRST